MIQPLFFLCAAAPSIFALLECCSLGWFLPLPPLLFSLLIDCQNDSSWCNVLDTDFVLCLSLLEGQGHQKCWLHYDLHFNTLTTGDFTKINKLSEGGFSEVYKVLPLVMFNWRAVGGMYVAVFLCLARVNLIRPEGVHMEKSDNTLKFR
jgi:hypothetical protein